MRLPQFPSHPHCVECPASGRLPQPDPGSDGALHHCGVPTVCHKSGAGGVGLIFLGQNPGWNESVQNEPFVGASGRLLKEHYVRMFPKSVSIYLMNAARCGSWEGIQAPSHAETLTCSRRWMGDDWKLLHAIHQRLMVVAVGGPAADVVGTLATGKRFGSLTKSLSHQGLTWSDGHGTRRAWFTYHPAYVMRDRNALPVVKDHLRLVLDALDGVEAAVSRPRMVSLREPPKS